jgi:hypothetical protein
MEVLREKYSADFDNADIGASRDEGFWVMKFTAPKRYRFKDKLSEPKVIEAVDSKDNLTVLGVNMDVEKKICKSKDGFTFIFNKFHLDPYVLNLIT